MKRLINNIKLVSVLILTLSFFGCDDNEVELSSDIKAEFTYTIDTQTGEVTFINISENATSYVWDLGNDNTSTEINPIETYEIGETYLVTLTAKNLDNQSDTFETQIVIADRTNPVITLNGDAEISLALGETFTDPGATAEDNLDGDISANIVVGGDTVDTNTVGTYVITYNVSDAAGNAATEVTRTITVFEITFDSGLINNGDFSAGATSWIQGVDDNNPAPVVTNGGDTYYSVNVAAAGNPWEVNLSQKLEIVDGTTYTLTFDAWSDVNRPIIAGIGLSADPWSSDVSTVDITTTRTTYTLTLTANGFGAMDARVLFDLGAAAGQVNIDNVSLFTGTGSFDSGLLNNGDFNDGATSWIQGVDDNNPAPVVTNGGDTYYSVNVAAAGNPWEVNLSQKLEIVDGTTYTLTFDAWSDVNRPIIAGIGLSADPWSSDVSTVDITTTRTTYTLTLTANGFGASDARVLFDLGAAAGEVNIDNVSLF